MTKPTHSTGAEQGQITDLQPQESMDQLNQAMEGFDDLLATCDLRESEERFRHAFEFAGTGMGILSTDGRWLRANHAICDMLGYSEDELRQTTYQELTHPDDLLRGREEARQVIAGDIAFMQIEKRYRHRDSHYLWAKLTTSVVRDEHGTPLYFVSQIENIDQRKRVEQDIALLSFAMNRIGESIYLMDENAQFKYVNDEACRELGYSRDELLGGMGVPDIDPDYQMEDWPKLWQLLKENHSVVLETRHKTKTGSIFPIEVTANHIEYQGHSYNLAIVRNLSERKQAEHEFALLSFAINRVGEAVYLMNEDGQFKYINDEVCRELGYSRDELLGGMGVPDIDPECQMPAWQEHWQQLKKEGTVTLETTHIKKTGEIAPVEVNANYFEFDGQGYNLALVRNISERKRAEQAQHQAEAALREQEERFRQMTENIEEVVWLTDVSKEQMLYVSPAYETIWGQSCENLYADPKQWLNAIHPDDRETAKHAALHHQARGEYDIEYRIIHPDGSLRYIHDRAFPIRDDSGKIYRIVGTAQDITARKEQEAHIQYLAYHDALTGLPNRALVMERLDHAIAQAHRHQEILAVLFLDLDRFKTINDTLGHPAGDSLLQQVAVCVSETLREEDTVGRVGGDEFLILLSSLTTAEDAAHVADKILESLSHPFKVANYELHVRASIGISVYPRDADNAETLVKYADTALYLAKEQGRNTFRFFSPELDASVRARLHLENDLRSVIDKNQLFLLYQPLMDLDSGQCTGAEALLRWKHPELGTVSPDNFIPVAEETGLIIPIGEWVLRTACRQARAWQDAGRENFRVSVNLSRCQLEQTGLAATLKQILHETGCPPQLLELEITESSTMNDPEQAIIRLQALSEMGIGLALDDYGTGYSSLAYLKRFPLDRLKIDRSFVEGIPEDSDDMAIVQTTIVLARQLRLKVVAEGVESKAQRAFLKALGCDEIQGYLIAKPLPVEELEQHCGLGNCDRPPA